MEGVKDLVTRRWMRFTSTVTTSSNHADHQQGRMAGACRGRCEPEHPRHLGSHDGCCSSSNLQRHHPIIEYHNIIVNIIVTTRLSMWTEKAWPRNGSMCLPSLQVSFAILWRSLGPGITSTSLSPVNQSLSFCSGWQIGSMDTWKQLWWYFYLPGLPIPLLIYWVCFLSTFLCSGLVFTLLTLVSIEIIKMPHFIDLQVHFRSFPILVDQWGLSTIIVLLPMTSPSWQVSVFTLFTLGSCLVTACNPLILELAVFPHSHWRSGVRIEPVGFILESSPNFLVKPLNF